MISAITFELGLSIKSFGSTTLNREDLLAGVEPDSCFYIQNARQIKGRKIDLQNDPPPDLAVEVDITRSSRFRLPPISIWVSLKHGDIQQKKA
ncbi:MAG: hypothetical protein HC935_09420 [Pseudanabaena sp. SU_2_4]|nr:hypothetical protein [Pseudanabaena sp. SU_2_4]